MMSKAEQALANNADTPIELPVTALGEVAELLREAQEDLFVPVSSAHGRAAVLTIVNDKLARARILVDVIRGDGQ